MKTFQLSLTAAATALLLMAMPSAIGSAAHRVGQYDFTYLTSGEMRATPVQVFDDGRSTYFQFRAGEAIPAIFQFKEGKPELLVPTFEGPYVRVPELSGRFALQLGRSQAQVIYGGQGRDAGASIAAVNTSNGLKTAYTGNGYPSNPNVKLVATLTSGLETLKNDALEANSYATPIKGDRVTWKDSEVKTETFQIWFTKGAYTLTKYASEQLIANKATYKNATAITVIGRDDDSYKEGLELERAKAIKSALIKLGADETKIVIKTGVMGVAQNGRWASDIRVESVMPTQVARADNPVSKTDKCASVKANLESLVRAGAMTQQQAQAMWRKSTDTSCAAILETETNAAKPAAKETAVAAAQPAEPPKPLEVPPTGFDFKASDRTISNTVRRWAAATNYQVVWDAPASSDAPINGDAVMTAAHMKEALEKIVSTMQNKGYDLQATLYSNRVIRFTRSNAK